MTLGNVIKTRGYAYQSWFGDRAEDINFSSTQELCESLGYILRNVARIDAEIPDDQYEELRRIFPNYAISTGYTSGGNQMKWGKQYRIYFSSTRNMPRKLFSRLQNDSQMRMTGSRFIEACFFIGFAPGGMQDDEQIRAAIEEIFPNGDEQDAFENGYSL